MSAEHPLNAPAIDNSVSATSSGSSDCTDLNDIRGDDGWEDAESDREDLKFISLLDNEIFSDIHGMLNHCKEKYGFDFMEIQKRLGLDFYSSIKLVNFIRAQVQDGNNISPNLSKTDFDHEKYLKPFLDDDAVLYNLDEILEVRHDPQTSSLPVNGEFDSNNSNLVTRVSELEEELRRTQIQLKNYQEAVSQVLDDRWQERPSKNEASGNNSTHEEKKDDDSHYFSSYSYNDIHETMLKDTIRTDAYRDFIYSNKDLFADKVVLDVGCGTGILSMFCAKAGAKRVIAVDNSSIIEKAMGNIFDNGLGDQITCLRGKIEEVTLPVKSVDIIVSEWMGYCLLYEAMLDSVIWARDMYLKPDGLMVPSFMTMWIAPIAYPEYVADHFHFWRDVYGFEMKAMQASIHEEAMVLDLPSESICGNPFQFLRLNLYTTRVEDLSFTAEWHSKLSKDIENLDGFAIWFDTFFMLSKSYLNFTAEDWPKNDTKEFAFTTGPHGNLTHWKQSVMFIDNLKDLPVSGKSGQKITGKLEFAVPEDNSRALTISVKWKHSGKPEKSQKWLMR
ncbi:Ribosomal protein arginine N-methyltransferase rmt3 [Golovinomyces cichoracearum]|uniref:type I protein arginine methyltransferase n=1 Tax=Golovinomyces cichoracearum TaxID=62708 RepID=A0A420HLF9_9PEZI|nr:Ribosomal protein arginine N-methyltransferase rmt3 [Golovinomyces cichoracearum]